MELEQAVARHYAHGTLEETILNALAAAGKDVNRLTPKDLAPVDEFHIGGRQATIAFAEQFGPRPEMRLLDIGCGLGGAARYFADAHGCRVTGIDLSAEYVAVANALAAMYHQRRIPTPKASTESFNSPIVMTAKNVTISLESIFLRL